MPSKFKRTQTSSRRMGHFFIAIVLLHFFCDSHKSPSVQYNMCWNLEILQDNTIEINTIILYTIA